MEASQLHTSKDTHLLKCEDWCKKNIMHS